MFLSPVLRMDIQNQVLALIGHFSGGLNQKMVFAGKYA